MTVGSLGSIVFSVSANTIKTLSNLKQSGSARYGKHQQHCGNTLLEYVGNDPDSVSFDIRLSARHGVDVDGEIEKIVNAEQSGEIMKFVIGKKTIGRYKWVITKHTVTYKQTDRGNNLILADVAISLTEYLK